MSIYKGYPERGESGGFKVTKDGKDLDPGRSQQVCNHSPDGFAWGYSGSGPSQLALAILLEETDLDTAKHRYQNFKWDMIAKLDMFSPWELTSKEIQTYLVELNLRIP